VRQDLANATCPTGNHPRHASGRVPNEFRDTIQHPAETAGGLRFDPWMSAEFPADGLSSSEFGEVNAMQIYGSHQIHGVHNPKSPHAPRTASPSSARVAPQDQVEISAAAEAAIEASEEGGIRADLVARVRQEIASGTYETPDKLDMALDRLLDQIG
jgi:negative regulator of flagellin synthesis FlgM